MRDLVTELKYRTSWKLRAAADMCMTGGPDPTLVGYGTPFAFPWTWHTVNVPSEKQRQRRVPRAVPRDAPPQSDDYASEYDVKRVKLVPTTKWWIPEPIVPAPPRKSEGAEQPGWNWFLGVAERFHEPSGFMQYVGYDKPHAAWAWGWGKNGRYKWCNTGYLSSSEAMAAAEAAAKIIQKAWLP